MTSSVWNWRSLFGYYDCQWWIKFLFTCLNKFMPIPGIFSYKVVSPVSYFSLSVYNHLSIIASQLLHWMDPKARDDFRWTSSLWMISWRNSRLKIQSSRHYDSIRWKNKHVFTFKPNDLKIKNKDTIAAAPDHVVFDRCDKIDDLERQRKSTHSACYWPRSQIVETRERIK